MKTKVLDSVIAGTVTITRLEIAKALAKALAPLNEKLALLTAENIAMREVIKQMREEQALSAMTPDALRARYDAMQ